MMNKIVLILIFLVSFNSYARVYEYDIELIPIKDKNEWKLTTKYTIGTNKT